MIVRLRCAPQQCGPWSRCLLLGRFLPKLGGAARRRHFFAWAAVGWNSPILLAGRGVCRPCSQHVRCQRGGGRGDPRHLRSARRALGRRRAAPAVPRRDRPCAGAGMREDHRRLAAAAHEATAGQAIAPAGRLIGRYRRSPAAAPTRPCHRADVALNGGRRTSRSGGGGQGRGAGPRADALRDRLDTLQAQLA
jgi:hypothetical protein